MTDIPANSRAAALVAPGTVEVIDLPIPSKLEPGALLVRVERATLCVNRLCYSSEPADRYPYLTGGLSEYCYVYPTSGRVKVPDGLSSEIASASTCALRPVVHGFERLGRIQPEESVVIDASGAVSAFNEGMAMLRPGGRYADRFTWHDMISRHYALDEVNEAFDSMADWQEIKPVIDLA